MSDVGDSRGRGRGFRGRGNGNWRSNRWRGNKRRGSHNRPGPYRTPQGEFDGPSSLLPYPGGPSRGQHEGGAGGLTAFPTSQTRITDSYSPVLCPFKGWKHYFPSEEYTPTCHIGQQLNWLVDYFTKGLEDDFDHHTIIQNSYFPVNYQQLVSDPTLAGVWPQLKEDLYSSPAETLATLSLAMYQVLVDLANKERDDEMEHDGADATVSLAASRTSRAAVFVPYIRARLNNFKNVTALKNIRAGLFGKLIAVNGTVVRASNTKPLCLALAFQCRTCSGVMTVPQPDGRNSMRNIIVEWQTIRIQENSTESEEIGRVPRSVDCELLEDLVNACSPGEVVTLIGIVKLVTVPDPDRRSKEKNMFTHYIDAVSVVNHDRGNSRKDEEASNAGDSQMSSKGLMTFNMRDYQAIRKIHEEPNLFAFLVASLCPSIFGHDLVKAGLLLSLFGGNISKRNCDVAALTKRSDIHVLVVGDPGLGKSQMLHAACLVAPRGVYVCGNSTTTSGLTVTLTKDGKTNGNEYTLEAGALVLADQGSCCIDEFDKMSGQHQALLEAMEQQSISLAKAGIVCTLPARTSILAAANPVGGHYDRSKSVSENIKLGPALLSRFDLVFLLLDRPDLGLDTMLTEHIMALHTNKKQAGPSSSSDWTSSSISSGKPASDGTLKSRLRLELNGVELLPAPLLRKYIAYAREYVHPKLSDEAKREVNDFYLHLRQSQYTNDSTPITLRQLESLVRLCEARAKAELREEATAQDARDVIELVKTSLDDVFKDEFGVMDFSRSLNGSGMSSRNEGKKFIQALQAHARVSRKDTFSMDEMKVLAAQIKVAQKKNFSQFIETLNNQGFLLNRGRNTYKLVVD